MNYWALKWLVETVVKNYNCPECSATVTDENIDVIWAAGNTINIDIECSECGKHSMVKSEVLTFDLANMSIPEWNLNNIKMSIDAIKWKLLKPKWNLIKDEEIVDLNSTLRKKNFNASDLFWDEK
jgi:DNA-directed RNA polymerase subunit RPC12/RpoP